MAFSGHVHAAIDVQRLAGDPGGAGSRQKTHGLRDVRGRSQAPERDLGRQRRALRLWQRLSHVRLDEAGSHDVDRDAPRRHFPGQRTRETADARLRGAVIGLPGIADQADHRPDVDDAASARLHHAAQHRLAEPENGTQIRRDDGIPVFRLHAQEQRVARDAGVVDEDGDRALPGFDVCDRHVAGSPIRHVEDEAAADRTRGFQSLVDGRNTRVARCRTDDRSSSRAQCERDGASDAARGAGDEGDFALQRIRGHDEASPLADASAASSDSGDSMACRSRLRPPGARRARPVSTLPGPHSNRRPAPSPVIAATIADQRTGLNSCRYKPSRIESASVYTPASKERTGISGASIATALSLSRKASAAGFIRVLWEGTDTGSGTARLAPRALQASTARATAAALPAMTSWPGAL